MEWRVVSNHLSKVTLVITSLSKLTWTLSIFYFLWPERLLQPSAQNKAITRTTFGTFFSFDPFQGTEKPQNRGEKVETK